MRHLHWILPAFFVVVVGASHTALTLWGDALPVEVTNILSLTLLPYLLSAPILKMLNMKTSEYWAMPDTTGFLLVTAACCLLLFLAGRAIQRLTGR